MAANKEKAASSAIEITLFTKSGGPLTKRISLTADGLLKSDGSECFMARGTAQRVGIISAKEFAKLIGGLIRIKPLLWAPSGRSCPIR